MPGSIRRGALLALSFLAGLLVACTDTEKDAAMTDSTTAHEHTNHLIDENSPYLLSHAHNPVDWYPWGEEALNKAKAEDKPIFLSIGYAACHWCHVMERESFENESIAAILNKHFVSIKVDREQRPDIDHIYMTFTQAMTGRGGWPMSVFLTPDLKPFFAGTYFPPEDRPGMPGFQRVISEIAAAYTENKDQVTTSADDIFTQINQAVSKVPEQSLLSGDLLDRGAKALMQNFDQQWGGFGTAPKFPHATELDLFLRYYKKSGDLSYLQAAEKALQGMARGGIYDHLGGGFARYSVDERWLVPHFEKMLYDNGLLVTTYANAYRITGNEQYLQTIKGTLDWLLREMTSEQGGFYSALDADSEGEEGKFYVWSEEEIKSLLKDKAELFMNYYNVTAGGNFEGHTILNIDNSSERVRNEYGAEKFDNLIGSLRDKLLTARNGRVRPATDDKILTSWNGLALSALAHGYQLTGDGRYLKAARTNATFVQDELWNDGRFTHAYREGNHSDGEFLEDYAYYIRGLIDLYESDPGADNSRWLEFASTLADRALTLFVDNGMFYLRPAGEEDLIYRPKDEFDSALPSEGSYMIANLFRLGQLTGKKEFTKAAEESLRAISGSLERAPNAMASALVALDFHATDKIEIVVVGEGPERQAMLDLVHRTYLPNRVVALSTDGDENWPLFEGRTVDNGETRAYLCRNSVCGRPAATAAELKEQLQAL